MTSTEDKINSMDSMERGMDVLSYIIIGIILVSAGIGLWYLDIYLKSLIILSVINQ